MESKTYVFNPEGGTSNSGTGGVLAMLPALMQRQGVDPALIALLNNKGNGNGFGNDLLAILILMIFMGNNGFGFGGNRGMCANGQGGVMPMLNNDANTAVIMQAVQRNGYDVQSLQSEIAGIKCKLPDTTTVQYSPVVGVPSCVAWQAGLAGSPLANGGFWG